MKNTPIPQPELSDIERFNTFVNRDGECHLWTGGLRGGKNGDYGAFWFKRKSLGAHRFAWRIANGRDPGEHQVNHKCDNRSCVNPDHLHLGDARSNIREAYSRGRATSRRISQRKFNANQVVMMRTLVGQIGINPIARLHCADYATIRAIVNRETYRDVA